MENGEKRNLKQFKCLKIPEMSEGNQNRRNTSADSFKKRFGSNNIQMIQKRIWQDEKDFTLEVPVNLQNDRVYGKGKKSDILDKNLLSSTNKTSKKVVVFAAISWYDVTKPFLYVTMVTKLTKKIIANICVRSCFLL